MFLKFRPLLFSLMFLLGLEIVSLIPSAVYYAAIILIIFSAYEGINLGKKWHFLILPSFISISSLGVLYLISHEFEQQIFIIISFLMYYLALYGILNMKIYFRRINARMTQQ